MRKRPSPHRTKYRTRQFLLSFSESFSATTGKPHKNAQNTPWHVCCSAFEVMDVSLYQAAAAMNAIARWQDMLSENLASAPISGGRKSEISFSDVQAGLDPNMGATGASYAIPVASTVTNFQPGELVTTGNPMDFALEGP